VGGLGRVGVVPAAAETVHELRYLLAYGGGAGAELQRQGHSYLHSLLPWIVAGVGLAAGLFLAALGRAVRGRTSARGFGLSLLGLWAACSICLILIYCGQELLEGIFAAGHPAGLAGIFGYGGLWAVPAAACVGLVLAALLHGARWAIETIAARHASRAPRRVPVAALPLHPVSLTRPRPAPPALGWCGRGPPA
jgi:hypothetical protein